VVLVLAGSVILSLIIPSKPDTTMKVDLPPDYNLPPGEELPEPDPAELQQPAETGAATPEEAEEDQEPPRIKRA
jgi:hypothetical protein